MANANKLMLFIVVFILVGILLGAVAHSHASPGVVAAWADNIMLLTDIFLRLTKVVIAPLVFSTLTVGIVCLGEMPTIGRVGGKAMVWSISFSILSILVGLFVVSLEQLGNGLNSAIPLEVTDTGLAVGGMGLKGSLTHIIPTSIAEVMVNDEILQIVVFSTFFDTGGVSLGEEFNAPLVAALDVVSHIMLKMTGYVTHVVLLAIFAAISSVTSTRGLGILLDYASFIGSYYVVISLICLALPVVGYVMLKKEVFRPVSMLKDPVLAILTTSGSEAAYPKMLEQLTKFGCSLNIMSFTLPIGCSLNLVGSMVYCLFASMFIAQVCNIHLPFTEITALMLTLMLASKEIAGVPRSALVVLAAIIPSFNIPVVGILPLMGVDHFLDMGRSAINVLGNGIATAMLAQDEGLLEEEPELTEREA